MHTKEVMGAPVVEDYLDALLSGPAPDVLRIGLAVPSSGVIGLTGPAGLAAAILAAEEVNAAELLGRREVRLVPIDAGRSPDHVAAEVSTLVAAGALDAVCGYHTSDVHRRIERVTTGRVPYLFTPPHEGGRRLPGVALLGESPREQLAPVMARLGTRSLRRWALIGNDYIWPREVHQAARSLVRRSGGRVVLDALVPIGAVPVERLLAALHARRVQAVLLSLVGRDLATFNRAFAEAGIAGRVVRASGALEETGLLEIGGDDSGELYAAMSWFASDSWDGLPQRFAARWGITGPQLGAYAQGCYRGVHAVAVLAAQHRLHSADLQGAVDDLHLAARSRLARADGFDLQPVA